ncbi:MAG: hypothetical protein SGJ20_09475 [Planctomycetota bacterium]|nr:hypothetical protein [Planctomycetota bacterium]
MSIVSRMNQMSSRVVRWTLCVVMLAAIAVSSHGMPATQAAKKPDNSLDLVPADASFYATSLRMKEQLDRLITSNAWKRVLGMSSVQLGIAGANQQLYMEGGPMDMYKQWLEEPANAELVELAKDMFTHEVFVYGGNSNIQFTSVALEAINAARYTQTMESLNREGPNDVERETARAALLSLNANREKITVPSFTLGMKITDAARAEAQLKRLEALISQQLEEVEDLKDLAERFKRLTVGKSEFLTLTLDGSMVPWDDVPFDQAEETEGEFSDLKKKLESLKLVISLGVKDGYLLFSIGENTDHLAKLGTGELLRNRDELKPLAEHLDKKIVSVSYASKEMLAHLQLNENSVNDWVTWAEGFLSKSELTEDQQKRILEDVRKMVKDIKPMIPEVGASMSFAFMTDSGYEGYSYDWTKNPWLDTSKPLSISGHLGGDPILGVAARNKYSPGDYELIAKWGKVAFGYFNEFAVEQLDEDDKEKYNEVSEFALPLIKRADNALRTMIIPGLADGQAGFAMDAKIGSKQWQEQLPAWGKELPLPEFALVLGVSDAELIKKGAAEFREIAQAVLDKVREEEPNAVPEDFKLQPPEVQTVEGGETFTYTIPEEAGLDKKLTPGAALSKSYLVLSTSVEQGVRLLKDTPLVPMSPIKADQSVGGVARFDFAQLIEKIEPWVDFGAAQAAEPGDFGAAFVVAEVKSAMKVLRCFRGYDSVTYRKDDAVVKHHVTTFVDLKD